MRKLLWGIVVVITASIIILSCQKEASSPQDINTKFDDKAAKEWYYGTYKKSAEWQGSNQKGKKLPDWKHPIVGKIGNNEVIEFPLIEGRSSYPISPNEGNKALTTDQIKRIAEAAISRIAFMKAPDGSISVREIDYIPDWGYLQQKNYDISNANILDPTDDFSGKIIAKKWDGSVISSLIALEGKIIKTGKKIPSKINPGVQKEQTSNLVEEECESMEFCIWQQDCVLTIYGDGMTTIECEPWYNTGECWIEEVCSETPDPCQVYGVACGGSGGGEEVNCDLRQLDMQGNVVSDIESTTTTSETATTREKDYVWVVYKQLVNLWRIKSYEHGVHVKVNNEWQWQSLTHLYISKTGTIIGGNISVTENSAVPYVGIYWASMQINYKVEPSLVCAGSPFSASEDFTSVMYRNVND